MIFAKTIFLKKSIEANVGDDEARQRLILKKVYMLDMCPRDKLKKIFVTYLFVHNTFYTMLELY